MGRVSRDKGARCEREIVDRHLALGIKAERYPLSGASRFRGSGHDVDIYVFGVDEAPACAYATIGGTRALSELAAKITWAQKHRGPGIRPLVQLAATWMPTRFGGRMRPHFVILPDWIMPDGSTGELVHKPSPQISGPAGAAAAIPAMTTAAKLDAFAGNAPAPAPAGKPATLAQERVREASLAEQMKDSVPF